VPDGGNDESRNEPKKCTVVSSGKARFSDLIHFSCFKLFKNRIGNTHSETNRTNMHVEQYERKEVRR
jgi:hypothetical protein